VRTPSRADLRRVPQWALVRVAQAAVTLVAAAVLVWSLQVLAPGDPARRLLMAGGVSNPTAPQVAALRAELGLDDPAPLRLVRWLGSAVQGDLGMSWRSGVPVAAELADRLPATLRLSAVALVLALVLAVPLAVVAVAGRDGPPDLAARGLMFLGAAAPSFVVGTLLLEIVVLRMGVGRVLADGSWSGALLPAIPLGLAAAALWARVLRTAMLDVATRRHVHVVQARGARRLRVLGVHVLPGASPPLLAAIGMTVGSLLAGAAVVETVFTWPGVGPYLIDAIVARDVPAVQGAVLLGVLAYVVAGMLADLAAAAIDPDRAR
jgi:ABC-type dipeptide/oligopeptide/nickel transport system permease component